DFNGLFHALTLPAGPHLIEIRKVGFEPVSVHVYVQPNQTMTFRASMATVMPAGASEPATGSDVTVALAPPGDLRFDVTPKDAQVYVDGYYVGIVDDFEGRRQRLSLPPGTHHVVLQESGYEPIEADVAIQSHATTTYRGVLTRGKPQS